MKPEEVVNELSKWGITTTRRTLLRYEKDGLIPEPYFRTGKATEYAPNVVAEFYASWSLIHGDYRIKPNKCKEIRHKAMNILYKFPSILSSEFVGTKEELLSHGLYKYINLRKGRNFIRAMDIFIYDWIVAYQKALNDVTGDNYILAVVAEYKIDLAENFGVPKLHIYNKHKFEFDDFCGKFPGFIADEIATNPIIIIQLKAVSAKDNEYAGFKYYHPDDYFRICPKI